MVGLALLDPPNGRQRKQDAGAKSVEIAGNVLIGATFGGWNDDGWSLGVVAWDAELSHLAVKSGRLETKGAAAAPVAAIDLAARPV